MLGLTNGELMLVAILVFAVVSARFWPAAGAAIAERLGGSGSDGDADAARSRGPGPDKRPSP